jgi:hypothetical protein
MTRQHEHDDESSQTALGWQLVLLRQLASHAGALAIGIEQELEAFDPDVLNEGTGVALGSSELNHVIDAALELHDLSDVVGVIAGGFLTQGEMLVLSAEEIAEEAARALSAGSAHRCGVILSARLLTPSAGFGALADAITSDTGLVSRWGSLTVRELLTAFRECEPLLIHRVCKAARIHPDDAWATLDFDKVARVADALRAATNA